VRSLRYRVGHWWGEYQFQRLIRDPGPPSFDRVRYLAFQRIQKAYNDDYRPVPAAFPATLVTVAGSDAVDRCGELVHDLVVHEVSGDHKTMLSPPHVDAIAGIVAAVVDDHPRAARV